MTESQKLHCYNMTNKLEMTTAYICYV